MITLYTSFYTDENAVRRAELEYCLKLNIDNRFIDRIMLFCEGDLPFQSDKITVISGARPTYRMIFDAINNYCQTENEISIISNTDIYFDKSLFNIQLFPKQCLALSRWDVIPGRETKLHNERFSQDVWVFAGKIRSVRFCDFFLGIPGCDNRIAWELSEAGYRLFNPARVVKAYHYHPSDLHNYNGQTPKIPKPYLFVEVR